MAGLLPGRSRAGWLLHSDTSRRSAKDTYPTMKACTKTNLICINVFVQSVSKLVWQIAAGYSALWRCFRTEFPQEVL